LARSAQPAIDLNVVDVLKGRVSIRGCADIATLRALVTEHVRGRRNDAGANNRYKPT
jgi:hypothetical protein